MKISSFMNYGLTASVVTSSSSVSISPQSINTSSVFPPPKTTLSKTTTAYTVHLL
ncbi:MAG: hypothetical protein ACJ0GE_04885 [Candidatus Actinomarina sp.]